VLVAGDEERPMPMHGGTSPGAPKGNRNAWKHGRYSAEAIARHRSIAELIRQARELMIPFGGVCAVAASSLAKWRQKIATHFIRN
jgi:hypothetical protein